MGLHILVIEDEPLIADFLVRGLREEGFAVEHAADGESGLHALSTREWDAVLLDWWLPVLDGLTVLQRYRAIGGAAPILFLTARDAVSDRVRGLDGGADDYLCKPFSFEELLARLRSLTRRRERTSGTVLSFQDVSVDLATHRAERAGQRLDLTAKEQMLLVFFLRHAGEVLSKTRIYEQVWDERFDGLSNTLEVHVMELRRKLEAHGPRLLHTLRGRGYMFGLPEPEERPHDSHRPIIAFLSGGLGVVLVGFSAAVLVLAQIYLDRQLDERLQSVLQTLLAVAEVEAGGIEWEPKDRLLQVGACPRERSSGPFMRATVACLMARLACGTRTRFGGELPAPQVTEGRLPEGVLGEDRRGWRHTLNADASTPMQPSAKPIYPRLVFTVAASEKPLHVLLERLAATLMIASVGIWMAALVVGRRLCRRAPRPVVAMADQARAMTIERSGERLDVPPSQDELAALGRSFNGLLDRLHEALRAQRRFTGDASHQLRTPLAALLGQVEVALRTRVRRMNIAKHSCTCISRSDI